MAFLSSWSQKKARWVVVAFLLVASGSGYFAFKKLKVNSNPQDLVSARKDYAQRYRHYLKKFGERDPFYVVIENTSWPVTKEIAQFIKDQLALYPQHYKQVFSPSDIKYLQQNRWLLPSTELKQIDQFSKSARRLSGEMKALGRSKDLTQMLAVLNSKKAMREILLPSLLEDLHRFLEKGIQPARDNLTWPWEQNLAGQSAPRGQELYVIEVIPHKDYGTAEVVARPLQILRGILAKARDQFSGVELGVTGRSVLHADELATTHKDMQKATILAFILCSLFFIFLVRQIARPLLALITLAVGLILSLGMATLLVGQLTLLSMVFLAMLVGLGIDFGIHYFIRFQQERAQGLSSVRAIEQTSATTGRGIWMGGMTTALAFLTAMLTEFKGLQELGLIAGAGLLICLVATLSFFPALLILFEKKLPTQNGKGVAQVKFLMWSGGTKLGLIFIASLVVGLFFVREIPFDFNLLNLQAKNSESVHWEKKLTNNSKRGTWYAAFIVSSFEQLDRRLNDLKAKKGEGGVEAIDSIRHFIANDQDLRLKKLSRLKALFRRVRTPQNSSLLSPRAFNRQLLKASKTVPQFASRIKSIRVLLKKRGYSKLQEFQMIWFQKVAIFYERFKQSIAPPKITLDNLPPIIKNRFVSADNKYFLIHAYPTKNLWEEKNMREFIDLGRSIDPAVTGTPVYVYESALSMKEAFYRSAIYALILAFVFLFFQFRSLRFSLLSLAPVVLGCLGLLALMPRLGISFNLANFFALPILIGAGVDGGVHIVHRFRETLDIKATMQSTGVAIFTSFGTTMTAFFCLCLAEHRGIASLGAVMVLGLLSIAVATFFVLPPLLRFLNLR